MDHLHPGEAGDAAEKIDRGDHAAHKAVLLAEGRERRLLPAAPRPDIGCSGLSVLAAAPVDRMIDKDLACPLHAVEEEFGVASAREELCDRLTDDVVGGRGGGDGAPRAGTVIRFR